MISVGECKVQTLNRNRNEEEKREATNVFLLHRKCKAISFVCGVNGSERRERHEKKSSFFAGAKNSIWKIWKFINVVFSLFLALCFLGGRDRISAAAVFLVGFGFNFVPRQQLQVSSIMPTHPLRGDENNKNEKDIPCGTIAVSIRRLGCFSSFVAMCMWVCVYVSTQCG